jgi:hypothetical protein
LTDSAFDGSDFDADAVEGTLLDETVAAVVDVVVDVVDTADTIGAILASFRVNGIKGGTTTSGAFAVFASGTATLESVLLLD